MNIHEDVERKFWDFRKRIGCCWNYYWIRDVVVAAFNTEQMSCWNTNNYLNNYCRFAKWSLFKLNKCYENINHSRGATSKQSVLSKLFLNNRIFAPQEFDIIVLVFSPRTDKSTICWLLSTENIFCKYVFFIT